MEHNYSIPKTKHIHKPIAGLLFTIALLLFTTIINPLTVHAAGTNVGVEAENSDGTYSSSGGKWYATYCTSAGYKGQGVLIYLLERNGGGAVTGTTPKAFPCSARMKTYELHAQDKYNRYPEVTTWEPLYPNWQNPASQNPVTSKNGGFMKDSVTSNVPAIKAWLKTITQTVTGENSTQGIDMVETLWGPDIATRFKNEEIILIAEPIVAVQFSQYFKAAALDIDETMSANTIKYRLISFLTYIDRNDDTSISSDLDELIDRAIKNMNLIISGKITSGSAAKYCIKGICKDLKQLVTSANIYRPLGDTYAGTSKMVAQYYEGLTPNRTVLHWYKSDSGRSYYRRSASASAYIPEGSFICKDANFTLLPASIPARQIHPTYNLQTYSIGMLAMLAWHDDTTTTGDVQTTCDESLIPTEHGAPDESTGNCVIIKTYRERINGVITADKGTYYRYDVCPNITIEDEGFANNCYRVIAWRETTSLARNGIDAFNWETSVPGRIGQSGESSGSVTLNNSNGYKYLYVLLDSAL